MARSQGRQSPDQRHLAGDAIELLAKGGRGIDDDGLQCLHCLAASFDGRIPRNLEVADHLDRAGAGFRLPARLAGQHGASGTLGVDGVALAFLVSQLAVGAVDLEYGMTAFSQKAGQAGTVEAGALDSDCPNGAQRSRPGLQCLISLAASRDGRACQVDAQRADGGSGVNVLVGIDARRIA